MLVLTVTFHALGRLRSRFTEHIPLRNGRRTRGMKTWLWQRTDADQRTDDEGSHFGQAIFPVGTEELKARFHIRALNEQPRSW